MIGTATASSSTVAEIGAGVTKGAATSRSDRSVVSTAPLTPDKG